MRATVLVLLLTPALACAQAGRVLLSVGEATLVRGAQETRIAGGTAVERGDTVRTGERSSVQIRMSDGSIVSLRSNTVFRIDEYQHTGGEGDRSAFSLLKGGLRTVSGAIARPAADPQVRTAARADAPRSADKKLEPARKEDESKIAEALRAPLRAVAGVVTRGTDSRHVVRTPTATVGIRGTHYTIVHCDNDCFEPRRTSVAAAVLAQSDAGSPPLDPAPNGTYGAVSDGRVGVANNVDDREFGALQFFYVASPDSGVQALLGPRWFLYDRLEAQERNRGQSAPESTETMARSGLNAESRSSELAIPPAPPAFVVTEQKNDTGDPVVIFGGSGVPPATSAATHAFLGAYTHAAGAVGTPGAFVTEGELTVLGSGTSRTLHAFAIASSVNASGAISGISDIESGIINETVANPIDAYWGRWLGGSVTDANGSTSITSLNQFHYLVAALTPPDVIAAKTGTFVFTNVGGTTPTNNVGETGTFLMSSGLSVNFTSRTLSTSPVTLSFQTQAWSFGGAVGVPIQFSPAGAFATSTATGSCSGSSCGQPTGSPTPSLLNMTSTFMGSTGDHVGMGLHARTLSTPNASAQTVQIFTCSPRC